jgi:hypothetical protein
MESNFKMKVSIPLDSNGMYGRECPNCKKYFKVKPGTGLEIDYCICPYCEHKDSSSEFATKEQLEYAQSIALKKFSSDIMKMAEKALKPLEKQTRNSFIQIKISTKQSHIPIKYYQEKDLETDVICDNCGCNFSIYGVFASCPDCTRLTTMSIFKKSIENIRKKLSVIETISEKNDDLYDHLLADVISSGVSAFDGFGKRLRIEFKNIFPEKPKNLFQNIQFLEEYLEENSNFSLVKLIGKENFSKIYFLFQVRHLWEHNFGEVDKEFVDKTGYDVNQIGKTIKINFEEANNFINIVESLGNKLRDKLKTT